ncbi:hypothetical protein [Fodinicurvata sediminis]|uniref:hypothetical protein n=1 Tax=Fodinicurvata sediminis TaxID=1121832 RepID=UPI0003B48B45|nr:hypothetical protein [Fodinicurvata sediminis]
MTRTFILTGLIASGFCMALASEIFSDVSPVKLISEAKAQQMGNDGWRWSRNKSMAAQFQAMDRNGGSVNGGGLGALNQYTTNYTSNSTSVGNLNEITQILSEGSEGYVGQNTDQHSEGNQGSSANTDVSQNNSINDIQGDNNNTSSSSDTSANEEPSDEEAPEQTAENQEE